jgi:Tol biopolymer transport system component
MRRQWGRPTVAMLIASGMCAGLAFAPGAGATSPGENGPIVWDSQALVNGSGDNEIWIMDSDGSNKDNLTDNTVGDERPAISPDRQKVAFMSFRQPNGSSGNSELYVMNANGSGQTPLTESDSNFEAEPSWSPDSQTIVWSRQISGSGTDVWTTDANGANKVNRTTTQFIDECCAEYSPDGTKIAYTASGYYDGFPGTFYPNNIWVMNANGTSQTQLSFGTGDVQNLQPTWSPDGSQIAYIHTENASNQPYYIYVMDADGSDQGPLTPSGSYYSPTWSPDGELIAAQSGNEIYAVDVDNPATVSNLTMNAVQDAYPSWAPAGGGGAAPNTKITDGPPDVVHKPRATFKFKAVPATGATFECKLDGKPFKPCESPKTYRNPSRGKHKVQVRASNGGGTDPTPAKDSFKYKP